MYGKSLNKYFTSDGGPPNMGAPPGEAPPTQPFQPGAQCPFGGFPPGPPTNPYPAQFPDPWCPYQSGSQSKVPPPAPKITFGIFHHNIFNKYDEEGSSRTVTVPHREKAETKLVSANMPLSALIEELECEERMYRWMTCPNRVKVGVQEVVEIQETPKRTFAPGKKLCITDERVRNGLTVGEAWPSANPGQVVWLVRLPLCTCQSTPDHTRDIR